MADSDDAYKAFAQTLIEPRYNNDYNDDLDSGRRVPLAPFINKQIQGNEPFSDEMYAETRRKGPANRILDADMNLSDDINNDPEKPRDTPLETLIPKIASGNYTKQDMMDFLNLTGTPL